MNLEAQIQQLHEQYGLFLSSSIWASENARWTELVFCLLHQCSDVDSEYTRAAVTMLQDLDLLDVNKLIFLDDTTSENTITFFTILKHHGFSESATQRAAKVLFGAANVVNTQYNGKIQRYLRQHGQIMRDELVDSFADSILTKPQLEYAIGHWLQNVLNLPISLETKAVREFCEKNKISIEDLLQASDVLNINVAIVDDLLELNQSIANAISGNPSAIKD
jgi:hypothetical protein